MLCEPSQKERAIVAVHCKKEEMLLPGPALAGAGPNARPGRGAPLSSDFMTSSCLFNRVTIRAQIYSKELTRELTTFVNVREEIRYF